MENFKPLLAAEADLSKLDYTNLWVSPKLDGIRAIVIDGVVMSRSLKPIPSAWVQNTFGHSKFNGFDGELICGEPNSKTVYNDTYRAAMKKDSDQPMTYFLFDDITDPGVDYGYRYESLGRRMAEEVSRFPLALVGQLAAESEAKLLAIESHFLGLGYEGLMLRAICGPKSHYKFGRSTAKEGTLLKLKRFEDSEAEIIGLEEEMANNNVATQDALGHTVRSSHKDNKVGKGRLGALVCRTPAGVTFNIGTGYTAEQREELWAQGQALVGKLVKYKHFAIGAVEAPRFPVYLGLRSEIDS